MGLRTKAKYEKECLKEKAFFLLRKETDIFYSLILNELIDYISSQQNDKQDKFHTTLSRTLSLLKAALSVNKIIAIILNKKNKQYELKLHCGYKKLSVKDFYFPLNNPFIKELKEIKNPFLTLANFKYLPQGYNLAFGIALVVTGSPTGAILFEKPKNHLTTVDKQYFRIISCLIELSFIEKERPIAPDTIQKLEDFTKTFIKELSTSPSTSPSTNPSDKEESKNNILNTINKLKNISLIKKG